jgi:hypothetical protein
MSEAEGKIETNSGNDDTVMAGFVEVWVGQEQTPGGAQWHVSSGTGDSPTDAQWAALSVAANDPNVPLADWWAEAVVKLPDWTGRVLTTGTHPSRGLLAPAVKQAARRAFK